MGVEPTDEQKAAAKAAASNPVKRPFTRRKGSRIVVPALVEYQGKTYEVHFDGRMYERRVTERASGKKDGAGNPIMVSKVQLVRLKNNAMIKAIEIVYRTMAPRL